MAGAEIKVTYGLHQNKPLNFKDDDGVAQGLVIDVFEHVAEQEGWSVEYKPCKWAECLAWLKSGEIDVLSAIGYTAKRAEIYDYTDTPLITNWGLVATQPDTAIQSILDLEGKTIAVMKKAGHTKALLALLDKFSVNVKELEVDSFNEVLQAIHAKQADAGVINRLFSSQFSKDYEVLESPIIFNPIEIRYAFTQGKHAPMIKTLDKHLLALRADKGSFYYRSLDKWFGEGEQFEIAQWLKWLAGISLAIALVLVVVTKFMREKVVTTTKESAALFKAVVTRGPSALVISDMESDQLLFANQRAREMFGLEEDPAEKKLIVGEFFSDPEDQKNVRASLYRGRSIRDYEVRMVRSDGIVFWCSVSIAEMPFEGRSTIATSIIDITERKRLEAERQAYEEILQKQAHFDGLTGLPNRLLFNDRLSQAIKHANRNARKAGLMFIDLDNFKRVNDTMGHAAGDELLKLAAERLEDVMRDEDTVARFGGDEFAVVVSGISVPADIRQVADKIAHAFQGSFTVNGNEVFTTASIGICIYPDNGETPDQLMQNADAAMYRAKEESPGHWHFYTDAINDELLNRMEMETQLRKALDKGEFHVVYQPIMNTNGGRIAGAEALLRWSSEKFGNVKPDDFIPVAEDTGLIVPLGKWVLETACAEAKTWEAAFTNPSDAPTISVNVSPRQLREPGFVEMVEETLSRTGLSADRLDIEITENMLMENTEVALDVIRRLNKLGIHISMDDFGTGYSSLSYLKLFPLDVLKIDQSFISDIGTGKGDETLVRAIISMAHDLGLRVVAEGVEQEPHQIFLQAKDCDFLQGFLFSEAVLPSEFAELLKSQPALP